MRIIFDRIQGPWIIATVCLGVASAATAHPLGNDSITHFNVLYVLPDRFEVDLLLDFAETPALNIQQHEIDADRDGKDTKQEQEAWLDKNAKEFAPFLLARLDDRPLPLNVVTEAVDPKSGNKAVGRMILKMPGFSQMPTYRLLIRYGAKYPKPLAAGRHVIAYEDTTYPQDRGLRRILLEESAIIGGKSLKDFVPAAGAVPARLREAMQKGSLSLSPDAVLKPAPDSQWLIADGGKCLAVSQDENEVWNIYRSPYVEILRPRPDYWNEGLDPFLYDQYDPSQLPQEKSATVRFALHSPCAPEGASTQPAVTTAPDLTEAKPPPFVPSFTDPRNNPAQTAKSFRQANRLISKLQGGWGLMVLLSVTGLSFIWGAAHALMPGHAKTVVAAYLISQHGTYRHAVILAFIVTITHTALVVILGLVIYFYQNTHPALGPRIQLWLGTLAGALVAIMGGTLIWRAITGRIAHHGHDHDHDHHHDDRSWFRKLFTHSHPHLPHSHPHTHEHGHTHAHDPVHQHHDHHHEHEHAHAHPHEHAHSHEHGHDHDHGHEHVHPHHHPHEHEHHHDHTHDHSTPGHPPHHQPEALSMKMLLMLGITGGIVPCPTAMIIMLLGIGANVVAGALYAVGVFSLGLAVTLMAIGFLALSSRRFARRLLMDAEHEGELSSTGQKLMLQVVPAISGAVVVALGFAITAHYVYMIETGRSLFSWLG